MVIKTLPRKNKTHMKARGFQVLTRNETEVAIPYPKLSHLLNCLPCPKKMQSYHSEIGVAVQIFLTSPHTDTPAILPDVEESLFFLERQPRS